MAVTGAIFKALTFNGESSRNYGVYITGQAVYNAPNRDVEMITIPGRSGSFPLDHGRYENIEVTYPAGVFADNEDDFAELISDFRNMLCSANGYCRLEDEYNPDEYRMAVYKSGLEVDPTLLKAGEFDITFECKPQRYLKSGEEPVTMGEWADLETHTGNPIIINTDKEVKNLDVELTPIQDLHGYDKPWSAGAGKNIGLLSDDNIGNHSNSMVTYLDGGATVTVTGGYGRTGWLIPVTNGTTYTISLYALVSDTSTGHTNRIYIGNTDSVWNVSTTGYKTHFALTGTRTKYTYTFTADTSQIFIGAYIGGSAGDGSGTITELQVEQGSTATTYEPYSNICPITGHDGVTVTDTGVNQWDEQWELGDLNTTNGANYPDNNRIRSKNYVPCNLSNTYYWKCPNNATVCFYDKNKAFVAPNIVATSNHTFTIPNGIHYLRFAVSSAYGNTYNNDISINLPSTDTAYHAYHGQSKTVTLPHTVYGGKPNITTGNGTETLANIASYNGETINEPWWSSMDEYVQGTTPTTGAQVVYTLATPTDLSTTPTDLTLYNGDNVVSSDGDMTLEIGKKITGVDNPTRFEASPELQIKGYGTVEINGHKITLNNEPFGNVTILENVTNSSGVFALDSNNYAVNGNTFTVSVSTLTLFECIVAPITEVRRVSWNAALEPTFTQTGESLFQLKQEVTQTLTKGTNRTESWGGSYQIFYGDPPTSHTIVVDIHIDYSATNDTILVYVTWYTGTPDTVREIDTVPTIKAAAFSNSTKSALGNPTIINCGDGEAYKIGSNGAISLDRYVDIGVELPSLKPGYNPVTVPGTVTEIKVIPRWWKL